MVLAVITQSKLYTPPDYGDDHDDHINIERGITLYSTLYPSIIKSVPNKSLYLAWDKSGLYVFSETLMIALKKIRGENDKSAYQRLVSDFTNYLKIHGIIR